MARYAETRELLPILQLTDACLAPVGFHAGNITDVTAWTNQRLLLLYLGRVFTAITSVTVRARVTTAFVSGGIGTNAEVGIVSGAFDAVGATLTRRGYTDVASTYNSTGLKSTPVSVTGIIPGMHLWAAFSNRSSATRYQLRAYLAEDIQSGVAQISDNTRLSTMPENTLAGVATEAMPWCAVLT